MPCTALRWCFAASLILITISGASASTAKFESWFPLLSRETYQNVSEVPCNATLTQYRQALMGSNNFLKAATCSWQQACILKELREDLKSRMASASVLLGLTPSLIASISPSVVETAILSIQNPVLSLLISLGCPTVFPSRVLEYEDPRSVLCVPAFQPLSDFHTRNAVIGSTFRVLKYLLLCIAAVNVFYTSWQLGTKTVVTFRCVNYTLVIIWTSLSVVIHIFATGAFYTQFRCLPFARTIRRGYSLTNTEQSLDEGQPQLRSKKRDSDLEVRIRPTNWVITSNYIATFLGYVHVLFGTVIFSSLLFIETIDAVTVILRYMASTLAARAVLMYELDHLRRRQQKESQGALQTAEFQNLMPVKAHDTSYSKP